LPKCILDDRRRRIKRISGLASGIARSRQEPAAARFHRANPAVELTAGTAQDGRIGIHTHAATRMNVERARFNMVEQQIRTWDVLDPRVLDLLMRVRREEYVPEQYRALAFADMEIPIDHGEKMLTPKMEARLVQELALLPGDKILEVGTGTGYMTGLLASLGGHVYSVDIIPEFTQSAAGRLASHGITNVTIDTGDAARGWDRHAPYDVIVLTGSVPLLADSFPKSLQPGGRLIAVVGEPPAMEAQLITCAGRGAYSTTGLFETCITPLRNAPRRERFVF
jgi:protein-L-isoaspartate(D-aspartate) O-methyltransferase